MEATVYQDPFKLALSDRRFSGVYRYDERLETQSEPSKFPLVGRLVTDGAGAFGAVSDAAAWRFMMTYIRCAFKSVSVFLM